MNENIIYKKYSSICDHAQLFSELKKRKPFLNNVIKSYFPKKKNIKILDIGCGYGALMYFANKLGYTHITGFDISASQIKISKMLKINNIYLSTFEKYFKTKKKFDLIIMLDVIEHLSKKKINLYLNKIYKSLNPNGIILIHTNNAASPFFGNVRYGDLTHQGAFTENSLKKILADNDFNNIYFIEDKPLIYSFTSFFRFLAWSLFRFIINIIMFSETGKYKNFITQNLFCIAGTKISND
jgi:2-polyprenyl-3-methyl-5-hydroxy-6-metoxy-1,4-benzoquinol methylase